ncbi:MAG TPA: TonB-dependent receptor [Janthinobacterium sp.]|jgi:vitamin B12 transporter|nr:TonB-dependent receptor [Janthinobacterium sp.]
MTSPALRHAAITSLALAIAAPASFAQTATDKSPDTVVVTATRTPQPASEVLSDTLVIGPEEIANSGAESVSDLLQRQRGIEVARSGGPGTTTSVFIRGANANQNVVLVDGVRIGSSTTGSANWSAIPLSAIDHIEIVYGPLSTLYGADAIGGVIQIFTKKGDGAPRLSAEAGAGSEKTREYDANIAGSTGGQHNFSYSLSAGKNKSDGFSATKPGNYSYNPDNDGYDLNSAAGQFSLQLDKGHEVGLIFLQSRLDAQYDNGPSSYDARTLQKLDNVALYSKDRFLPNWSSLLQLSQAQDKSGSDGGPDAFDQSQINTKQTDLTWQNDIVLGRDLLQILFEHRKEEVLASSTPELNGERDTNSVAASYSLKRGAQQASFSLRNDNSTQYGSKTTGSIAYGYHFSNALRATASYGTSFRAPTFNDLYYPGYGVASNQPEQGRNIETGLYYDDGVTQLGAVYYHNRVSDLLVSTPVCPIEPETHPYGCAYNVDKALLEGLTLSARRQFGAFGLSGSIDLQDPRDESTDLLLARRARQHADFSADYAVGAFKGGVEWQLSGKRYDDPANQTRLGGYGLINLFGTYKLTPDWSLLVRWNNATNKQYEQARYYGTPGSQAFVGLRYGIK